MMKTLSLSLGQSRGRAADAALLPVMIKRFRYRRSLRRLLETSPHLVSDIGLSLIEARREASKAFWQE
ncbi:DUF1127 domain-containing protein [Lacibacterium aquatile]|uniref:DUF1127 domain-containing protein n=1 Tax=Lacibacterium aquatile TaxID=1168082 RepID=A0ABW5DPS5_9PROT